MLINALQHTIADNEACSRSRDVLSVTMVPASAADERSPVLFFTRRRMMELSGVCARFIHTHLIKQLPSRRWIFDSPDRSAWTLEMQVNPFLFASV